MIAPFILTWIEKGGAATSFRIKGVNSCPLELIAAFAGPAQIIFIVRPSTRDGDEMIYLKGAVDEVLSAQTVFAAIACSLLNLLSDSGRNIAHEVSGFRKPRRTASTIASDLHSKPV